MKKKTKTKTARAERRALPMKAVGPLQTAVNKEVRVAKAHAPSLKSAGVGLVKSDDDLLHKFGLESQALSYLISLLNQGVVLTADVPGEVKFVPTPTDYEISGLLQTLPEACEPESEEWLRRLPDYTLVVMIARRALKSIAVTAEGSFNVELQALVEEAQRRGIKV